MTETTPKHTPLHGVHEKLGASFTDFGGWDMPLKYGSELGEHKAVREAAGIFDLSHMGEVRVTGPDAAAFLDFALVAKYSKMKLGKARYGVIVDEHGYLLDDLITYRIAEDEYLVVPNAGNTPVVAEALTDRANQFTAEIQPAAEVTVADESGDTALIAVQGPKAEEILLATQDSEEGQQTVRELGYYAWAPLTVAGIDVFLARTGYTGEDGFELIIDNQDATALWAELVRVGDDSGLTPCGLASRDSLRLEAGMPLYGNELTRETTPFDAGLGRMVGFTTKETFFAREALEKLAESEPARVLVGLTSEGRRAARSGATVSVDGSEVGIVTSGQPSPTLGHPIALAYVDTAVSEPGSAVSVDIRGKAHDFVVVELPFYSRSAD
ncbi:glycine cleavage system aminomethyltransferase GcvT [Brevibacterium daeguense]|uniref:Aminomethyltransferase n=1 Tax=Brevibacterium daeguense TaxID=909936 RepID=A0ABP8EK22_9MICO|nr:glycine cleavage system aminomethyltransferase GcvT [Brevibacterium daeguense]